MSLSNSGWTHKQQATICWKLIDESLRCKQRVILRTSASALESLEGTTGVTRRNAGGYEQSFEAIESATRARHRTFHRIDFGAGAEAFCANLCILRGVEFSLVYQVNHLGYIRVYLMILYNARAVTNRMFLVGRL